MAADLESIYLGMRRSLMATALRVVRDPQIAEDLAQESYLRVRRAMEKGPVEHVEAFLHRTAHNLALDYLRKNRTRGHVETMDAADPSALDVADATPSAEERMIQADRLRHVEDLLTQLPDRARRVWLLSRVEGWPYPRIAEHLGVSPNTVFNDVKLVMGSLRDLFSRLDRG
ncbi:MAG: RNA polymerase sigma factor [Shinella zoogloeoides]|uniref:RNA polymerase sigma factor n=1 Tax=Shinella zoogloeoides TaxID=352475 RepID=UPI003C723562